MSDSTPKDTEANGTDQKLIGLVLAGQREAYAELIRRHHPKVRNVCMSMLAGSDDADDAVQEIFLKVYSCLSEFGGRSAFATWLYRIAANHCLAVLRKTARQREVPLDALSPEAPTITETVPVMTS